MTNALLIATDKLWWKILWSTHLKPCHGNARPWHLLKVRPLFSSLGWQYTFLFRYQKRSSVTFPVTHSVYCVKDTLSHEWYLIQNAELSVNSDITDRSSCRPPQFNANPSYNLLHCRGITRIHRSPSRPRPSMRPTAAFINIHEHRI